MDYFAGHYLRDERDKTDPLASPLLGNLTGLPPALIITAECDPLRDEGEAYAHKLMQAGVNVTAVRYLGTIHDFVMLNPLAGTPAVRSAVGQANEHLRSIFASK